MSGPETRHGRIGVFQRRVLLLVAIAAVCGVIAVVATSKTDGAAQRVTAGSDAHAAEAVTTTTAGVPVLDGIDTDALVHRIEDGVKSAGGSDAKVATLTRTTMATIRASMGESDSPPDERKVIAVKVTGDFSIPTPVVDEGGTRTSPRNSNLIMWFQVPDLSSTGSAIVNDSAEVANLSQYGPTTELSIKS